MQPHDEPSQYTPAYETFYQHDIPVGTPASKKAGWSFPALFRTPSLYWVLVTEAGLDGSYCGGRLAQDATHNLYRIRFPDAGEGNGTGHVQPSSTLPWSTPWRVVMVGKSLGDIVQSSLVTHLSTPSILNDDRWVRPGRVSWSWWSDPTSPKNPEILRQFVDLAAEMGWEYSLVDANWTEMEKDAIPKLVQYANSKGIGIILWYNSGGPHNTVTEKPRDRMFMRDIRRKEFQFLRSIGVKGVKVDFFQSDKQNIIQLYEDILKDAADFQIMVNFHGCTLPRGWTRTYPHLMSMEAVRGAESYIFDPLFPKQAPIHNTILPFTRNVMGPMDYTPVAFSNNHYPHLTSAVHELALSVVFESGWIHFADRVAAYRNLPEGPKQFLKQVPAAWDELHFIDGAPGRFVVLARRKGEQWFIGGINATPTGKQVSIKFDFLGPNTWKMREIRDGNQQDPFAEAVRQVKKGELLEIPMNAYGGFVLHLTPETEK